MVKQKNSFVPLSKDMMSPYFLRPLKTLFWCPAECQNQSRAASNAAPRRWRRRRDAPMLYTEPKLSSFTQRFLNQLQSPTAQPGFFFARHTSAVRCKCTTTSGSFFFLLFFLRLDLSPFFHAVLASMMHIAQIMSENNRYIVQIWTINDNIEIVFMCEENVVVLPKITKNISQWIQQVTGCNQMFGSEKSLKPYSILKTQIIGHNNILSFLRLNDWICKLSRWIYWIHNTFFQVARSSSRTFGIPWV